MYYNRIDKSEGIDLAKSNESKECMVCHYLFFNRGFEFKILYAMVVMIWQCCVLIQVILLLLLLKMLIIVYYS